MIRAEDNCNEIYIEVKQIQYEAGQGAECAALASGCRCPDCLRAFQWSRAIDFASWSLARDTPREERREPKTEKKAHQLFICTTYWKRTRASPGKTATVLLLPCVGTPAHGCRGSPVAVWRPSWRCCCERLLCFLLWKTPLLIPLTELRGVRFDGFIEKMSLMSLSSRKSDNSLFIPGIYLFIYFSSH